MFVKQSEEKIATWLKIPNLNEFCSYLLSGTIHGKPGVRVAELARLEKIIGKSFTAAEKYALATKFLKRPEYTARNIGTHLLIFGWPENAEVIKQLIKAADDQDWIVREYAAGAFATFLQRDFRHFSKLYLRWVKVESINVKRAIALAVKFDSKSADPKKWDIYFNIIDPLMSEEAEYIRKNLGPFAIGDGLLSRYPEQILASCKDWAKSKNENVRWNTAMIFTAAAARKFAKTGHSLLRPLLKDPSPFVSRAAKKALKNLEKSGC